MNGQLFSEISSQVLNLISFLKPIISPMQYLAQKSYKLISFILQSILFSTSVINIASAILIILGLIQTATIFNSKHSYLINIMLGVFFLWLHLFEFSDYHHRIHELISNVSGFYVAFCCVQGCAYIKQKIDPSENKRMLDSNKRFEILAQFVLMAITAFTAAVFIILWYNVKISKQIAQLHNNYKLLAILLLSVFTIYTVSGLRSVSLFLPGIVSCLCLLLPIFIKVIMYAYKFKQIQSFIPVYAIPIVMISSQGRYKHINHSCSNLREKYSSMDKQFIDEKVKSNRIFINNMYRAALGYFLYSQLHGNSINIEYMVIAVYIYLVGKGSIS